MLTWCSYCQQFAGEMPPYEDLAITHVLCRTCEGTVFEFTDSDLDNTMVLERIQKQLSEAGRRGDLVTAKQVIDASCNAGIRGVDILIGVIAPKLFQIGEDWKRGLVTVAEEHRFTAFCEKVLEILAAKMPTPNAAATPGVDRVEVLLINAPGNCHTLAVQTLALWLADKGMTTRLVPNDVNVEDLVMLIGKILPKYLVISMALAEQIQGVIAIVNQVATLPVLMRPKIIVGGYAVKLGFVPAIPGAVLLADISAFPDQ